MQLSYVILYVSQVDQSINFYQRAFGLEHKFTHDSGDYAEMKTGETTLAFCKDETAKQILGSSFIPANSELPLGSQITMQPDDVKEAYSLALECGAQSICAPSIKPWSFEVAMVRDPDGHIIELARPVK